MRRHRSRLGDVKVFGLEVVAAGAAITLAVLIGLVVTHGSDSPGTAWNAAPAQPLLPGAVASDPPVPIASPTPSRSTTPPRTAPPAGRRTTPATAPAKPPPSSARPDRASLEWTERAGALLRHRNFLVRLDAVGPGSSAADRADATFAVRPGLARSACLSLESVNFPGRFVRHRDFVLRLESRAGTDLYRADATFCPEPGRSGFLLRSVNYPDRVVVAGRDGRLVLARPARGAAAAEFRFGRPPA